MLFFINFRRITSKGGILFKYISCYSLSVILCFHGVIQVLFKYISCYSLSFQPLRRMKSIIKFKYISCYSLSSFTQPIKINVHYSNTSHVILYLKRFTHQEVANTHSNTSHVILYRICTHGKAECFTIQIHLMLFFIG